MTILFPLSFLKNGKKREEKVLRTISQKPNANANALVYLFNNRRSYLSFTINNVRENVRKVIQHSHNVIYFDVINFTQSTMTLSAWSKPAQRFSTQIAPRPIF
jgi:hypothetical protein